MISPLPGTDQREIGILRTFADEAERDAFYQSALFQDWEAYASTLTEEPVYRPLTGLEAWFRNPVPPPRWKMAVVTFCGVLPTSVFLSYTLGALLRDAPTLLRLGTVAAAMVGLLTWVVMPFMTRIFRTWLRPE